jgi:predicted small secreted protein
MRSASVVFGAATRNFLTFMKGTTVKSATAALLALMMMLVAGCNTVEGAGKDVKAGGQAIEKSADKAKTY